MKRLLISALLIYSPLAFAQPQTGNMGGAQTGSMGGKIEFEGTVQSMPEQAPKGEWKVSGLTVTFGDSSALKEKDGKIAVGTKVEVEGILGDDGKIMAKEIETETE